MAEMRSRGLAISEPEPEEEPRAGTVVAAPAGPSTGSKRRICEATVQDIMGSRIQIAVDGQVGLLTQADMKLRELARRLEVGQRLKVFMVGGTLDGLPTYSAQGLLLFRGPDAPFDASGAPKEGPRTAFRPGQLTQLGQLELTVLKDELEEVRGELDRVTDELERGAEERSELGAQLSEARKRNNELRQQLRNTEKQLEALERGKPNPLDSEDAFLMAVRVEYAQTFNEADRTAYPLRPMRVGRSFLRSVQQLEAIKPEKIVAVCAQVACGRASALAGRAVHHLGINSEAQVREKDGAKAWRCSLRDGPAAPRLHWWDIGGATKAIEFASVGIHDDFSIPE